MKMIVGLGNPGKEYDNTRHNIGFMILDNYAKANNYADFHQKFNGLYTKFIIDNETVILLKPLSFMNLSGQVIQKYANYFKIKTQDIMIIHDDLDLPLGKIKIKAKGSSGGHNGIKSIIHELNTDIFARFKIGISNNKEIATKDYVLGKFSNAELKILQEICAFSNCIIDDFIHTNVDKVMSKYNGANYEIK